MIDRAILQISLKVMVGSVEWSEVVPILSVESEMNGQESIT